MSTEVQDLNSVKYVSLYAEQWYNICGEIYLSPFVLFTEAGDMFEKLKAFFEKGKSMLEEAFVEPEEDTFVTVPEGVTCEQLIEEAKEYVDAIIVYRHGEDKKDAPQGESPVGEASADEAPADEAPADEAPADEALADEAPIGEAPAGEAPDTEEKKAGEAEETPDEDKNEQEG